MILYIVINSLLKFSCTLKCSAPWFMHRSLFSALLENLKKMWRQHHTSKIAITWSLITSYRNGWVKTWPEISPDQRPFWQTWLDLNYNLENLSNPRYDFVQPDCDLTCTAPPFYQWFLLALLHHPWIWSKLTKKWEKNLTRAWPEPNFTNPSPKIINPRPDPS